MAIGDRIYIADKETLDTVNSKCTTIQTYTNNLNSRLTSTRAGYLDYLANSTYGLNAIKSAINTVDSNVDSIRTYTATNNTASKTGVLSQKSAYIINMLENSTYGLNAIKSNSRNISHGIITDNILFDTEGNPSLEGGVATTMTINGSGVLLYYYIKIGNSYLDDEDPNTINLSIYIDNNNNCIESTTVGYATASDQQYTYIPFESKCTIMPRLIHEGTAWYRNFGIIALLMPYFHNSYQL